MPVDRDALYKNQQKDKELPCYAWSQALYMSMERYMLLRDQVKGTPIEYTFSKIPDGNTRCSFIGKEKDVRELAKKVAAKYMVKRWTLLPLPRHSFLYKGLPAYQDDLLQLQRPPSERDKL